MNAPLRTRVILGLALLLAVSIAAAGCSRLPGGSKPAAVSEKKAAKYYCPMHPTYTSDKPGTCPICNMNLVPMEPHDDHSEHEMKPTDEQTTCLRHECPMLKAGENCPMLIVTKTGEVPDCPVCKKRIADKELGAVSSENPEGYAAVALTPAKRKLIRLETAKIETRSLKASIRTAGLMLGGGEMDLFVYESDLPRVSNSSTVKAVFPALGRELDGQISRIPLSTNRDLPPSAYGPSAVLNAGSSQLTIRARMTDPDGALKRGMTADAEIWTDLGSVTALPEEAVFFTGKQNIVFVEKSDGVYEPRSVKLGTRGEGYYAVLSGLEPGETVVTSGNFLIDSESRLKAAVEGAADAGEKSAHAHG